MQIRSRKSQAAFEFITTYGWALLAVAIVLIALIYVGIFKPAAFFPRSVYFAQGILVPDYSVTYFDAYGLNVATFTLLISNGIGNDMKDVILNITECNNGAGKTTSGIYLASGMTKKFTVTCEGIDLVGDSDEISTAVLNYYTEIKGQKLPFSYTAKIMAYTQRMQSFPDNNLGRRAWAIENGGSSIDDVFRFVPCSGIPGCEGQSADALFTDVFGGYVDSKTGKVWSTEESVGSWAVKQSGAWDNSHWEWDFDDSSYERVSDEDAYLADRDDLPGTAFDFCAGMDGFKIPGISDFDGLLDCEQCLPPYGTYPTAGIPYGKWYWTDEPSDEEGFATCIHFVEDTQIDIVAKCSKDEEHSVRCVKDNP
ncbi:hypothetical protein H6503_04790 [Candidatus Woesearchaeota archaeon]|nr:hypothetical protein [Candidatus Woesearchaeota archaeon]